MRLTRSLAGLLVASLLTIGCGSDHSTDLTGPTVRLSAAQATILMNKITQIAPVHPELAWLADSANLVLRAGAQIDRVDITTDLAPGPFYAVSLQRAVATSTNSFATFDLIAFDNPSNPTAFMIVNAYADGSGTTPPHMVGGHFETLGGGIFGHLFRVSGNTVEGWRAVTGDVSFTGASTGSPCDVFQSGNGVTCAQSLLQAAFSITIAWHDNVIGPANSRRASLAMTNVPGVLLNFMFP
jgi:FAD/FMN-containing dehydrogenase